VLTDLGKRCRISRHRWLDMGNMAGGRKSRFRRIRSQPGSFSEMASLELSMLSKELLTCVPPSPGSVLYQSPWCGPASWDWPWSPWAVARANRAAKPAMETIIVISKPGLRIGKFESVEVNTSRLTMVVKHRAFHDICMSFLLRYSLHPSLRHCIHCNQSACHAIITLYRYCPDTDTIDKNSAILTICTHQLNIGVNLEDKIATARQRYPLPLPVTSL
jgi:hypothetical protein